MTSSREIGASVRITAEAQGYPLLLRGREGRTMTIRGDGDEWVLDAHRRGRVVRTVRLWWFWDVVMAASGWLRLGVPPPTVEELHTDPRRPARCDGRAW